MTVIISWQSLTTVHQLFIMLLFFVFIKCPQTFEKFIYVFFHILVFFVQFIICLVSCALYKVEFFLISLKVYKNTVHCPKWNIFKYWENKIKIDLNWCSLILIFLKFIRIFVCFRSIKFYNKNTIKSKKCCTKQVSMTFLHVRKEWCTVYI